MATTALPNGFRPVTAAEGDLFTIGRPVLIHDAETHTIERYRLQSFSGQWGWLAVPCHAGSTAFPVRLEIDDPDLRSDELLESGAARRGPEGDGGRYVPVVPAPLDDLAAQLGASLATLVAFGARVEIITPAPAETFTRDAWFHTTDGGYFASDADRRAHQRTLDERGARAQHRLQERTP